VHQRLATLVPGIGEADASVGGGSTGTPRSPMRGTRVGVLSITPFSCLQSLIFVGPKKRQKDPLHASHISKTFNHLSVLAHAMMKVAGFQAQSNVVRH
jgi:hypothetical protein